MKSAISLNSLFNSRWVARTADGIALDRFSASGADAVVSLFAAWGLSQSIMCIVCVVTFFRYRSLMSLMFLLLLLDHVGRSIVFRVMPVAKSGTSPGPAVNVIFLFLLVVGLALSCWRQNPKEPNRAPEANGPKRPWAHLKRSAPHFVV